MQIILIKPVRKLGQVGQTINVKNGYARNYLIPNELAIMATKENIAFFAKQKKELEEKNANLKQEAELAAKGLTGKHLTYISSAAADGKLFGSVGAKNIAADVSKLVGSLLSYDNIFLDTPIKLLGVYQVEVSLHPEVLVNILVVVARSESEAADSLREYKSGVGKKDETEKEAELDAIAASSS